MTHHTLPFKRRRRHSRRSAQQRSAQVVPFPQKQPSGPTEVQRRWLAVADQIETATLMLDVDPADIPAALTLVLFRFGQRLDQSQRNALVAGLNAVQATLCR